MPKPRPVVLTAVGDMMFDTKLPPPRVLFYQPEYTACVPASTNYRPSFVVPFVNSNECRDWLRERGIPLDGVDPTSHRSQSILFQLSRRALRPNYSFKRMRPLLLRSDLVFGNLECPLSLRGRPSKLDVYYRAAPAFAEAMASANISVVSFSNNHCMDYGEVAFLDTLKVLRKNRITPVGAVQGQGKQNNPTAVFDVKGIRIAFIACNLTGPETSYAVAGETGILPLNEVVVNRELTKIRDKAEFIVLSVHWGIEGVGKPMPQLVRLAHQFVDQGVDIILGHHPHVPGSVEIYKNKAIFYSLGNFIFGHTHSNWTDNFIVRFQLLPGRIRQIDLLPIATAGSEQFQPGPLKGKRAVTLLESVQRISESFKTRLVVKGNKAKIDNLR